MQTSTHCGAGEVADCRGFRGEKLAPEARVTGRVQQRPRVRTGRSTRRVFRRKIDEQATTRTLAHRAVSVQRRRAVERLATGHQRPTLPDHQGSVLVELGIVELSERPVRVENRRVHEPCGHKGPHELYQNSSARHKHNMDVH